MLLLFPQLSLNNPGSVGTLGITKPQTRVTIAFSGVITQTSHFKLMKPESKQVRAG